MNNWVMATDGWRWLMWETRGCGESGLAMRFMRQKMYVDVGTNSYRLLDKSKLSSKQVPHHVIHTSWEITRLSKKRFKRFNQPRVILSVIKGAYVIMKMVIWNYNSNGRTLMVQRRLTPSISTLHPTDQIESLLLVSKFCRF